MVYLSRFFLNPQCRQVQSELSRPYQMHRTLMRAFPEQLPANERVLFRVDDFSGLPVKLLLVQSIHKPAWDFLRSAGVLSRPYLLPQSEIPISVSDNPEVKLVEYKFYSNQTLIFRLQANPTKKIKVEGRRNGRRVGLVFEEDRLAWLTRKLEAGGADLEEVRLTDLGKVSGKQSKSRDSNLISMVSVRFDGVLKIKDPGLFLKLVEEGVGSGKAIGFGLISVA